MQFSLGFGVQEICNKQLKSNFQFTITQNNNGCSFLSIVSVKLLLSDIEHWPATDLFWYSVLSIVTALACKLGTGMSSFDKNVC